MEAHLFCFYFSFALTRWVRPRRGPFTEQTPWRNGSASDSKSEGWGFESLWRHARYFFFFALPSTFPRGCTDRGTKSSTPWRNGSASDSKSEGWGFESLWRQAQWFSFVSLWPNWTRRLTTNQKIGGSSPSRDNFCFPCGRDGHDRRRSVTGQSACSVMVIIGASQALDPGSIPGRRIRRILGH